MSPRLLVLILLLAAAVAYQPVDYRTIPIITRVDRRDHVGQFALKYQLGDGTEFSEQGTLKRTADNKDNVLVKRGKYRYISPEGVEVKVEYTADENGFHVITDNTPQPQ